MVSRRLDSELLENGGGATFAENLQTLMNVRWHHRCGSALSLDLQLIFGRAT
jgi:hypothetical protein